MSKQGDDCYFYFYSTCTKGDKCAYRHCEAALGNETVCTLWQEGRCFRNVCRFRHMEIDKKRSEIPCYWENQPGGCQKANCAFHHAKGRYIDGQFLPPSKTTLPSPPESADDDLKVAQMSLQQNKLSVQSNPSPQLRGVMKVENSENVPSPTHPPVVINAADDDEDDDDQLSEEGEETKTPVQQPAAEGKNGLRVISTRKGSSTTTKEGSLNFGIKTLEEIKSQKMKEKNKRHGEGSSRSSRPSVDSVIFPAPEKENVRTVVRTVTLSSKEGEEPVVRLDLADKQGKRKASAADVSTVPVKRSLAERLGKKVEVPGNADKAPKRGTVQVPKSLKDRLGLPPKQTSTERGKAAKPMGEIHVKTLEEIRRERALQRRETQAKAEAERHGKTEDSSSGARPAHAGRIKTFSEALSEKKNNRLVEEKKKAGESHTKIKIQGESKKQVALSGKGQVKEPAGKVKPEGEVRVKTLEEIKREKALRMQQSEGNVPAPSAQPGPAPAEQKSLRSTKPTAPEKEEKKAVELNRPFPKLSSTSDVQPAQQSGTRKCQVKSGEEGLWEKRQQREQQEKFRKEEAVVESTAGNFDTEPAGKEAAQFQDQEAKTNFTTKSAKPSDGKVTFPKKKALKRKAPGSYPSAVAAVKPLTAYDADMMGPPAKRAAMDVPDMLERVPATRPEENPRNRPEAHLGSQERSVEQVEVSSSTSASSQLEEARTRRLSSAGNAPLSADEDFEKLLWEISGGRLEAEIDLDPGKDEDDLLLELSKMIDS